MTKFPKPIEGALPSQEPLGSLADLGPIVGADKDEYSPSYGISHLSSHATMLSINGRPSFQTRKVPPSITPRDLISPA